MSQDGWITVAEFETVAPAYIMSDRLSSEGVPNRVVGSGLRGGPMRWIWVPPEWKDRALKVIATPAVEYGELTREALSYPPPDDA